MGGTSKSEQTSQQSAEQNPWAPTVNGLTQLTNAVTGQIDNAGLSDRQSSALDTLQTNADKGNPYASQVGMLADEMLAGGTDRTGIAQGGYDQLKAQLDPFARGDYVDPSKNTALQGYLTTMSDDITNRIRGQFAASGRGFSGAETGSIARGISEGTAPTLLNAYNSERNNQLSAINSLYGAGNQTAGTLSGLDQTKLGNQTAGVDMANRALSANDYSANKTLEIEAQRLGIPLDQYSKIAGILGPLGQLGGTSTSNTTQTGSNTMSGAQQFATIASGIPSLMPKSAVKF